MNADDLTWHTIEEASSKLPKKASGVYFIRKTGIFGGIVYVGESHKGKLKRTMRRHFQRWTGPTAGPTYSRAGHRVAYIRTKEASAIPEQNRFIEELRPRDNTVAKPSFWDAD